MNASAEEKCMTGSKDIVKGAIYHMREEAGYIEKGRDFRHRDQACIQKENLVGTSLYQAIFTGLLKRTLSLSRNRIFSQSDVEEDLEKNFACRQFYKREVTEVLGALIVQGLLEQVEVRAGDNWEDKYRLREDSLGRKLALLHHRRKIIQDIIRDFVRINPVAQHRFDVLEKPLLEMEHHLKETKRGDKVGNTLDFVRLHSEFWAAVPETIQLDYWHEVLRQLGDQITLSRIPFPEDLARIAGQCRQVFTNLTENRIKTARRNAKKHLEQFENTLYNMHIFLRSAVAWTETCPDQKEKEEQINAVIKPWQAIIRRIVTERRSDYPAVPVPSILEIKCKDKCAEEWAKIFLALTQKLIPIFPIYAHKYLNNPADTGQPVLWLIHLTGQLLNDPIELLEISKVNCTKTEIRVLELMAGGMTFREIGQKVGEEKSRGPMKTNSVISTAQSAKRKTLDTMNSIEGMSGKVERIETLTKDIGFMDFFSNWHQLSGPAISA